jgi:hypothetical protein
MSELWDLLGRAFTPDTLAKALQRGMISAGFVLLWIGVMNLINRRPGSLLGYWLIEKQRTSEAMSLAAEVGPLEGKAEGLKVTLDGLLREMEIAGKSLPSGAAPPVSVNSAPSVLPPPPVLPAVPMLPKMDSVTSVLPPPPPPSLPQLPPPPALPPVIS